MLKKLGLQITQRASSQIRNEIKSFCLSEPYLESQRFLRPFSAFKCYDSMIHVHLLNEGPDRPETFCSLPENWSHLCFSSWTENTMADYNRFPEKSGLDPVEKPLLLRKVNIMLKRRVF